MVLKLFKTDEAILAECYKEMKGDFEERLERDVRLFTKMTLEKGLELEMTEFLEYEHYEHGKNRRDYRNGHYALDLLTRYGMITGIRVPRCRKGGFIPRALDRYQRQQESVKRLIEKIFLGGVSTRLVGQVLRDLLGYQISAQSVSNITKDLTKEVEKSHRRALDDAYQYLILDGVSMKYRVDSRVRRNMALVAMGITYYGKREVIDYMLADSESAAKWEIFLNSLYRRGLTGERLRMIVTDGGVGLIRGIETVYPSVPHQRCWVHKMRNASNYMRRSNQKACLFDVKKIYLARNRQEAIRKFHSFSDKWSEIEPKAVKCIEKDLDTLLSFFDCPEAHWKLVRTTNAIERTFREVRRRTRPMTSFKNKHSCERIVFAIINGFNLKWQRRSIRGFDDNVVHLKKITQFI